MKSLTRLTKSAVSSLRREKVSYQPERELGQYTKFIFDALCRIDIVNEVSLAECAVHILDTKVPFLSNEEKLLLWTQVVEYMNQEVYFEGWFNYELAEIIRQEAAIAELLAQRLNHENLDSASLHWTFDFDDSLHQKLLTDIRGR